MWFLAIPHMIIINALGSVSNAVGIVSWFIILFTGKLPSGLAHFQAMVMRYTARSQLYAGFLYDQYPRSSSPCQPRIPAPAPVHINFNPALENRNRLTTGLRLLWAIPAICYAILIAILGSICWFLSFFAVLFTGRWPDSLHLWVIRMLRVSIRINAYILLPTDEYPPFTTD